MHDDENPYYECDTCSYGASGPVGPRLDDRLDAHEAENAGHRMVEANS
jgi:hypothetical protein